MWSSNSGIATPPTPATKVRNTGRQNSSVKNTPTPISSSSTAPANVPRLLPSQLRRLLDAIEPLQREDRVRKLVGAVLKDRTRQGQEFLLHRGCVRERV